MVDRVFRGDCATREVYDESTKDIALSVVGGINCEYYIYWIADPSHYEWLFLQIYLFSGSAFYR